MLTSLLYAYKYSTPHSTCVRRKSSIEQRHNLHVNFKTFLDGSVPPIIILNAHVHNVLVIPNNVSCNGRSSHMSQLGNHIYP